MIQRSYLVPIRPVSLVILATAVLVAAPSRVAAQGTGWSAADCSNNTGGVCDDWNTKGPWEATVDAVDDAVASCQLNQYWTCIPGGGSCPDGGAVVGDADDLGDRWRQGICLQTGAHGELWYTSWPKTNDDDVCGPKAVDRTKGYDCIDPSDQKALQPPGDCIPIINPDKTNPCDPVTGNKSQTEVDYSSDAAGVPAFARYYNSKGAFKDGAGMPVGWRHTYSRVLDEEPDQRKSEILFEAPANQLLPSNLSSFYYTASDACEFGWDDLKATVWGGSLSTATATFAGGNACKISSGGSTVAVFNVRSGASWSAFSPPSTIRTITRPSGASYRFEQVGSAWVNPFNGALKLEQSGSSWIFTDQNDSRETYDSAGRLISIQRRNGQIDTLEYDLTVAQGGDGDSSTLDKVTGPFGHELSFAYDTNGDLISITTPDGVITYGWDNQANLSSVTYPDTSVRQYVYEDPDFPHHLTGIIDENSDRFATWRYDDEGRATLSEHAGGKEQVQLAYNTNDTTTFTTATGASRTYSFETHQGRRRLASISGDACSTCAGGNIQSRTYDANGYLDETTDWNGNVTKTARNSDGLVTTVTEAKGSTEERVTTTTWHAMYRLPTQISTTRNDTDLSYDGSGNLTQMTVTDGVDSRTWTMTYNGDGQVLTVDGPRTDVSDITTFTYNTCTTGNGCGQLATVSNALSQVTTFDSYDASGRLTQMTDPNGLQTALTYDDRGNVLTVTQTPTVGAARVTTMTYDDAEQLLTMTTPAETVLTYTYSAAHYLTSITDNLGNEIVYDYDAMGNLTDEDIEDPLNVLRYALDYAYDLSSHLDTVTSAGITTDLSIDSVGNLMANIDGNQNTTQHAYDALNRLEQTTDALLGTIDYSYDVHDNVTAVTAANGAKTSYAYDDLDNLTSEMSPDRGVTSYTYDSAGNRLTATGARSVTATYTYDALNRVTAVSYPNSAENVTYGYDDVSVNGVGRLTSISDQSGTTSYSYDEFGSITSVSHVISGVTYTTSYQYDADGRIAAITYPGGRVVGYSRNAAGYVTQVTSTKGGVPKTVLSSVSYEPFGPISSLTHGNGVIFDYDRQADYQVTDIYAAGITDQTYSFDNAGNISGITDTINSGNDRTFGFDALNRLTTDDWINSPNYAADVLADGPLAYWRLGEASGTTAVDETGNGHDGSYNGGVILGQHGLVAGNDTSMRVNTTAGTDYAASPTLSGATPTGVEFWYQVDGLATNQNLVSFNHFGASKIKIYHRNNGYLVVWNANGADIWSNATVSTNEPHHIALWYDSGANTSYLMIDGVVQNGTVSGNVFSNANPYVMMGAYLSNGTSYGRLQGEIDEVALYDTSVTSATFAERGAGRTETFGYDANGNRTSFDDGTATTSYGYTSQSNRLTTINSATVQRDLAGNRTADIGGLRTYTYNNANRLSAVLDNSVTTASYTHNSLGQRTLKTVGASTTVYIYDLSGNLLAEHDSAGTLIRDYVWLDSAPVAQIEQGESFIYLHTDHLKTPRYATNDTQTVIWRWDSDAFGTTLADEDPDGNGTGVTVNLRFPGQYFDVETGLHYNYYRTYDPRTGRYLESDPIGLVAGLNTYAYVRNMPTTYVDPYGLDVKVVTDDPEVYRILTEAYARVTSTKRGMQLCEQLEQSSTLYKIMEADKDARFCDDSPGLQNPACRFQQNTVFIDPFNNPLLPEKTGLEAASKAAVLAHELAHAAGYKDSGPNKMDLINEVENPIRESLGEPARTDYYVPIPLEWEPGTK